MQAAGALAGMPVFPCPLVHAGRSMGASKPGTGIGTGRGKGEKGR